MIDARLWVTREEYAGAGHPVRGASFGHVLRSGEQPLFDAAGQLIKFEGTSDKGQVGHEGVKAALAFLRRPPQYRRWVHGNNHHEVLTANFEDFLAVLGDTKSASQERRGGGRAEAADNPR